MPFVNEVRLNPRQWAAALLVLVGVIAFAPALWKSVEPFQPGADYRVPYSLSRDYWLYERRLQLASPTQIVMLGDSVVWGEYVRPDGTLSHFLNERTGQPGRFVNAGVNGLFPLAMEGLVRSSGGVLKGRKILLHANVLWMTSPKVDLQTEKEERFNHAELVPQFHPRIPAYKADAGHRLGAIFGREFGFFRWANHLQIAYFGQQDVPTWSLAEDGGDPSRHPNIYRNPLRQITLRLPGEGTTDPERGPGSPRHKAWSSTGTSTGSTRFEWVDLDKSLQWAALVRVVEFLRDRGNGVVVVLGPFNEHIMTAENRASFRKLRDGIHATLQARNVAVLSPVTLPSALYADASHPLTEGYRLLAEELMQDGMFRGWVNFTGAAGSTEHRAVPAP